MLADVSAPTHETPNPSSPIDQTQPAAPPRRGTRGWMTEAGLVVVRWSNWGKHRLYVNTVDDRRVGWLDLDTGEPTLEICELETAFEAALLEAATIEARMGDSPRRTLAEPLVDLAARRPGEHLEVQIAATVAAGRELRPAQPGFEGKRAYSAMELGIIGERAVAVELDRLVSLDTRWRFINSIPVGKHRADIDHLVVGPGGVFTLNSKHHHDGQVWVGEDALMVNHTWQHYVRDSRAEAERVSSLLTTAAGIAVSVSGLLVLVGVANLTVKAQPDDVRVLDQSELVEFLLSKPPTLDDDAAALVLKAARVSCTWQ